MLILLIVVDNVGPPLVIIVIHSYTHTVILSSGSKLCLFIYERQRICAILSVLLIDSSLNWKVVCLRLKTPNAFSLIVLEMEITTTTTINKQKKNEHAARFDFLF